MHPWFDGSPLPRVLAHRGLVTASDEAEGIVENSFAAVTAAHAAGVVYIESDCHLTADGEVVLFHDADLRRVTGDPRTVAQVRLRELDGLMSSRGGLITLRQALETFPDVRFNIDVKSAEAAVPAGRIVAAHAERVLLTSFDDERRRAALAAATVGSSRPATSAGSGTVARFAAAAAVRSRAWAARALAGIDALQIPERQGPLRLVSPRSVALAHEVGVEVHVWTVNEPERMHQLLSWGVDGIVTDVADIALEVVAGR
ncbi:glycerophosphodiester phosphodiesterase family protein [Microbacterium xanthum]|uniref:glycerophosphodiester phosphodiesterase family protein n=1 Tax=Microbacterium xanthum TaxID=3079794 RepID=UPI002AD4FC77|nr:glycerophosphodiester phosphodiesterase family protein [Microbacterium sp. KSW-48]MDZ8172687.1 glycerophosphodiester phosphodiesterase family protein [Microbacterium sp. KSW-48]